jgi:hypothetical protein
MDQVSKPTRRWRFSLRTLFVITTLVAVVVAWGILRPLAYQRQKSQAAAAIHSLGGTIERCGGSLDGTPGGNWLARLLRVSEATDALWGVHLEKTTITADELRKLEHCTWIRRLDLSDTAVGDEAIPSILTLVKLRELRLAGTQATDKGIAQLAELPRLWRLDSGRTAVTYDGLAQLEAALPGTNFQEQRALVELPGGKSIQISSEVDLQRQGTFDPREEFGLTSNKANTLTNQIYTYGGSDGTPFSITPGEIEHLRRMRSTDSLDCLQTRFGAEGLAWLRGFDQLRWASFSDCDIQDSDLRILASLPALETLSLRGNTSTNAITDEGIANLKSAANHVKQLEISLANVTPRALGEISQLTGLEKLRVRFWHFDKHGGQTKATPERFAEVREQIARLASLPKLTHLTLGGRVMADKSIEPVLDIKSLEELTVPKGSASDAMLERLRAAIPSVVEQ